MAQWWGRGQSPIVPPHQNRSSSLSLEGTTERPCSLIQLSPLTLAHLFSLSPASTPLNVLCPLSDRAFGCLYPFSHSPVLRTGLTHSYSASGAASVFFLTLFTITFIYLWLWLWEVGVVVGKTFFGQTHKPAELVQNRQRSARRKIPEKWTDVSSQRLCWPKIEAFWVKNNKSH